MSILDPFDDWKDTATYDADAVIFSSEDPADTLYLVLEGNVALSLRGEALSVEGRGALIGEMAIIGDSGHSTSATALDRVRLARISPTELRRLIGDDPEFSLHAMSELAKRLRAVDSVLGSRIA
jgi:CRP-like cAMP-binding protein